MIYKHERLYDITDYGADKKMRIDAVLKILQEMAIAHSDSVGYSTDTFMGQGTVWLHNKVMLKVDRLPDYSEKISGNTWARSMLKFKGLRNYLISSGDEVCVTASSIWIYFDINKKRPIRISPEMAEKYKPEEIPHFDDAIEKYSIKEPEGYDEEMVITLRPVDFDVNNHVGNVIYSQLAAPFLDEIEGKTIAISYLHEIPNGTQSVTVKSFKDDDRQVIGVYNGSDCACLLEVTNG